MRFGEKVRVPDGREGVLVWDALASGFGEGPHYRYRYRSVDAETGETVVAVRVGTEERPDFVRVGPSRLRGAS